jgi:hypothetical protein
MAIRRTPFDGAGRFEKADIFMFTLQSSCCMKMQAIRLAASRSPRGGTPPQKPHSDFDQRAAQKSATFFHQ